MGRRQRKLIGGNLPGICSHVVGVSYINISGTFVEMVLKLYQEREE